ncbi:unnamed protein product [Lathyrus oleraceus]|uniref:MYB-like transcription factor ETC3 n=1 Tax=Pisum sativum TaxID=3888 RepID=UPI001FC52011|nr:MYB-like transcription factor ETC3 [Pisum sativum]
MESQNKAKISPTTSQTSQEVSSETDFIEMSEQEVDLIRRMHDLVGDRWNLIAGRVPGRKAEEIERFWTMRQCSSCQQKSSK